MVFMDPVANVRCRMGEGVVGNDFVSNREGEGGRLRTSYGMEKGVRGEDLLTAMLSLAPCRPYQYRSIHVDLGREHWCVEMPPVGQGFCRAHVSGPLSTSLPNLPLTWVPYLPKLPTFTARVKLSSEAGASGRSWPKLSVADCRSSGLAPKSSMLRFWYWQLPMLVVPW